VCHLLFIVSCNKLLNVELGAAFFQN